MTKQLILHNQVEQISQLECFISEIADETGMDTALAMSMNLALEEAVTNVVLYAYPEGTDGEVNIDARFDKGILTFVLKDSGVPFDPTAKEDADITLGVEERPIGGLGIFLVKQLMDTVSYNYSDGCNILTMTKKLQS